MLLSSIPFNTKVSLYGSTVPSSAFFSLALIAFILSTMFFCDNAQSENITFSSSHLSSFLLSSLYLSSRYISVNFFFLKTGYILLNSLLYESICYCWYSYKSVLHVFLINLNYLDFLFLIFRHKTLRLSCGTYFAPQTLLLMNPIRIVFYSVVLLTDSFILS